MLALGRDTSQLNAERFRVYDLKCIGSFLAEKKAARLTLKSPKEL